MILVPCFFTYNIILCSWEKKSISVTRFASGMIWLHITIFKSDYRVQPSFPVDAKIPSKSCISFFLSQNPSNSYRHDLDPILKWLAIDFLSLEFLLKTSTCLHLLWINLYFSLLILSAAILIYSN